MSAWKACDVRGVFPGEVNPQLFHDIGRSLVRTLRPHARVLVAGDFRLSTPDLKFALGQGLMAGGAIVIDAGQVPTPIAYFANRQWGTDAIFIVTASHNPPKYNGLKLMIGYLPPSEEELLELRSTVEARTFECAGGLGYLEIRDPAPLYTEWIEQRWHHLKLRRGLRIVLDAGNGAWALLGPLIFERLGFAVCRLFCEVDGRFPNRSPDCARAANLWELSNAVIAREADAGIAWDGDGDRVAFIDNHGKFVSGDEVSMLMARKLLDARSGEKIAYDLKLSDVFRQTVIDLGGIPLIERSGHTFLKRRVISTHCLLGCEISGHYFFRELNGGDDGVFAALHILELLQNGKSFAELRKELPRAYVTPDLRLRADPNQYQSIIRRLRESVCPKQEVTIDGSRMQTDDGFVLVRQSVTEPAVTLRIEGSTDRALRSLIELCSLALPEFSQAIQAQICQEETR